jgi:hypothetical protein
MDGDKFDVMPGPKAVVKLTLVDHIKQALAAYHQMSAAKNNERNILEKIGVLISFENAPKVIQQLRMLCEGLKDRNELTREELFELAVILFDIPLEKGSVVCSLVESLKTKIEFDVLDEIYNGLKSNDLLNANSFYVIYRNPQYAESFSSALIVLKQSYLLDTICAQLICENPEHACGISSALIKLNKLRGFYKIAELKSFPQFYAAVISIIFRYPQHAEDFVAALEKLLNPKDCVNPIYQLEDAINSPIDVVSVEKMQEYIGAIERAWQRLKSNKLHDDSHICIIYENPRHAEIISVALVRLSSFHQVFKKIETNKFKDFYQYVFNIIKRYPKCATMLITALEEIIKSTDIEAVEKLKKYAAYIVFYFLSKEGISDKEFNAAIWEKPVNIHNISRAFAACVYSAYPYKPFPPLINLYEAGLWNEFNVLAIEKSPQYADFIVSIFVCLNNAKILESNREKILKLVLLSDCISRILISLGNANIPLSQSLFDSICDLCSQYSGTDIASIVSCLEKSGVLDEAYLDFVFKIAKYVEDVSFVCNHLMRAGVLLKEDDFSFIFQYAKYAKYTSHLCYFGTVDREEFDNVYKKINSIFNNLVSKDFYNDDDNHKLYDVALFLGHVSRLEKQGLLDAGALDAFSENLKSVDCLNTLFSISSYLQKLDLFGPKIFLAIYKNLQDIAIIDLVFGYLKGAGISKKFMNMVTEICQNIPYKKGFKNIDRAFSELYDFGLLSKESISKIFKNPQNAESFVTAVCELLDAGVIKNIDEKIIKIFYLSPLSLRYCLIIPPAYRHFKQYDYFDKAVYESIAENIIDICNNFESVIYAFGDLDPKLRTSAHAIKIFQNIEAINKVNKVQPEHFKEVCQNPEKAIAHAGSFNTPAKIMAKREGTLGFSSPKSREKRQERRREASSIFRPGSQMPK